VFYFRATRLIKIDSVSSNQCVPIVVDDVFFVRIGEAKARSKRVSRPIRSGTQDLSTGKIGADRIVGSASSLVTSVRSRADLWNVLSTGESRFRLRRAAYNKAS